MAEFEVVVVGAGSAGCVLAGRLAAQGRQVLLLEAGPEYPLDAAPADIVDARAPTFGHDWGWTSVPGHIGRALPLPRARLVGGCSATNACFALRGSPADYDRWAAMGNAGWSFADCLPAFRSIEADADFGAAPWHGAEGPLPIRRYREPERNRFQNEMIRAAVACSHPLVEDHNAPGAVGVGPVPVNAVDGVRIDAARAFLGPVRTSPHLAVRSDTLVDRVELRAGRATGVRLASGEMVGAGLVVLAAGTYSSPAILLRSGIGPAADLTTLCIRCELDLPGVGRNLADHPWTPVRLPVSVPTGGPGFQAVLTWRSASAPSEGPPDLQIFAQGPFPSNDRPVASLCCAVLKPHARGSVTIASADPASAPLIDLALLADAGDVRRLAEAVREARRMFAEPGLAALAEHPDDMVEWGDTEAWISANVRSYHHPVGACAMGPDPAAGAVVNAAGWVHGIAGLMVADASIMPEIPSANTHLATLMLAERLAARLAGAVSV